MARGKKEMNQDEVIQNFMETPVLDKQESKEPEKNMTNKVVLNNKRTLTILPTKLKYFKSGDYNTYKLIKDIGVSELLSYSDGYEFICKFLSAVFDKPYKIDEVKDENGDYKTTLIFDDYVKTMVEDELNIKELKEIVDTSLRVNEIDAENF